MRYKCKSYKWSKRTLLRLIQALFVCSFLLLFLLFFGYSDTLIEMPRYLKPREFPDKTLSAKCL